MDNRMWAMEKETFKNMLPSFVPFVSEYIKYYIDNVFYNRHCFAPLQTIDVSEVKYLVVPDKSLTKKEIKTWLTLCKKYKTIPDQSYAHLYNHNSLKKYTSIKAENKFHKEFLYLHLSSIRCLREFPEQIKLTIKLYEMGINFYLAICLAKIYGSKYDEQNFLAAIKGNAEFQEKNINKNFPLKIAVALKKFVNLDFDFNGYYEKFGMIDILNHIGNQIDSETQVNYKNIDSLEIENEFRRL